MVGARDGVFPSGVVVRHDDGCAMDWVTPVAFIAALAVALFVVPRAARHIAARDAALREGWAHPHVDRERKEPRPRTRPRKREPESEEDSP